MIHGDLSLFLTDHHVAKMAHRKGYMPMVTMLIAQDTLCKQLGVKCDLRGMRGGSNSWELTIASGRYLLRWHRPFDAVIDVRRHHDRALLTQWTSAEDIAAWFDAARATTTKGSV